MRLIIGDVLVLKPKTLKAKNRLNQYGDTYCVLDCNSVKALIGSCDCGQDKDRRWIEYPNDPDFEILSVNPREG